MNWYKKSQQGLMFYFWDKSPQETSEKVKPYIDPITNESHYKCHHCGNEITEDEVGLWFINKEGRGQQYNLPEYDPNLVIQGFTEISNYLKPFYNQYQEYIKSKETETEGQGYGGTWGHSWEAQTPGLESILNKYPIISELFNLYGSYSGWYLQKIMKGAEELNGYDLDGASDIINNPTEIANKFIKNTRETFEIPNEVPLCEECAESLEKCTSCDKIIKPGENSYPAVWSDTEKYCEDCIENGRADVCSNCGLADSQEDMHYREDEGYICKTCYEEQAGKHIEWASDVISKLNIPIGKNYPTNRQALDNIYQFMDRYINKYKNEKNVLTEKEWERIYYLAKKSRLPESSFEYLEGLKEGLTEESTVSNILEDIKNNINAQDYIKNKYPGIKNFNDLPFDINVEENYIADLHGFTITITPSDKFLERAEKSKPGITKIWNIMSKTPHHPGTLAYARCAYDEGDSIVINNLQRDADFENYKSKAEYYGKEGKDFYQKDIEAAKWLDNKTKYWNVFLLDLLKSFGISEDKNVFLTTFDQQKDKWGNLPVHKSKKTYQEVPEQMGMPLEEHDVPDLVERSTLYRSPMYQVANWYKKLKFAQIWNVESDGSFQDELFKMHKLEYELFMIKEKPFSGLPQRRENIIKKIEKELRNAMNNVKKRLIRLYKEWLDKHAILNPGEWARQRGNELSDEEDIEQRLASAINEYEAYAHGEESRHRVSFDQAFREILNKISQNMEAFPSLQNLSKVMAEDYKENIMKQDAYDDIEDFNSRYNTGFTDPQQAEEYIENMTIDDMGFDLMEYVGYNDWQSFVSLVGESTDMEQFLREFYQNMVFPVWYAYWKEKGIDKTREKIEGLYKELLKPHNLGQERITINRALGATHQTGEMLDYLEEEISEESGDIKNLLDNLTKGTDVPVWNQELKTIGVNV